MITKAVFTLFLCIPFAVITESNALRVSFAESDSSVSESDGSATVRVTKSGLSRGDVVITLIPMSLGEARMQGYDHVDTSASDPAEIGMDFSTAQLEHVFGPGIATVDESLSVDVVDDAVYEHDELFVVRLNVSVSDPQDAAELEIGIEFLELRILTDSRDEPILREVGKSLREGDGVVEDFFAVIRETESELPISFGIKVNDNNARFGIDYELLLGEYTIHPNQSNVTIPITVVDDVIAEDAESFSVILLLPQSRSIPITIADNDMVVVRVGNGSVVEIKEGESATLCAEIVSPAEVDREIIILGALTDGTATAESDFVVGFGLVYGFNGNRRFCQDIQTVEDEVSEPNESFSASLATFLPDPLVRVEPDTITFSVADDDVPMIQVTLPGDDQTALTVVEGESHTITVSVPEPNLINVTISVTVSPDTAEKDADFVISVGSFTLSPGTSSLELPLSLPDDLFVENDEHWSLIITHSTDPPIVVPVTILDNDLVTVGFVNDSRVTVGEGEVVRVCGKMADTTPSFLQREIVLQGTTESGTASENTDFVPLMWNFTFSSSSPAILCVEVVTIDDSIGEIPEEFAVSVKLSTMPEPLISVDPSTIVITISNDDMPMIQVTLPGDDQTALTVVEGESHTITVSVPEPNLINVTISVTVSPDTAEKDADFVISVGSFTLSPGTSSLELPLSLPDDLFVENDEHWSLIISHSTDPPIVVPVTILDNDPVTVGFVNDSRVTVGEGEVVRVCGKMADSTPSLLQREIVLQGTTESGTASENTDFVPLMWNFTFSSSSPAILCVEVVTIDDSIGEIPEEFAVSVKLSTMPEPLISVDPSTIVITISNDDMPMIQVTLPGDDQTALTVVEGESHTITVSVPEPNLISVTISVTVSPDTAEKDADFVISVGSFTLSPGTSSLELPLSLPDDLFVENDEHWSLIITHSTDPPIVVPVTILDNDPVTVGFVNDSRVTVGEGEVVRVCGKMADSTPSLLQREIVLQGTTESGTASENTDFVPLMWNFTFSSSSPAILCVEVVTIDDPIREIPEEFAVSVNLATMPEPLISVDPSTIVITISNDDIPELEVDLVGETPPPNGGGGHRALVKEGDGLLDELIRIYFPGDHSIPLQYHVSITPSSAEDITVSVGTFTIPQLKKTTTEVFLPVSIVDDSIAEDEEEVTILIRFNPGGPPQIVTLIIQDNDEVVVSGTGAEVEEGGTAKVCSCIVSPKMVDRTIAVLAKTESLTATAGVDYTPVMQGLSLNATHRTQCFEIQTFDNEGPNHPLEFEVLLKVIGQSNVRQERDSVRVTITDDDGTPLAPVITDIKLFETDGERPQRKSHNLTISWKVTSDELRPVDYFTITVTLHGVQENVSTNDDCGKSNDNISKSFNFTVDGNTTDYTIVGVELAREYTVVVCSWNSRGSNCSTPGNHSEREEEEEEEGDGLPAGVIVSIVMLVLFVLVYCCLCCLCLCLCCCKGKLSEWISYHPEKREVKYAAEYKSYREYHTWQGGYKTQTYHTWQGEVDSDFDSDIGDEV